MPNSNLSRRSRSSSKLRKYSVWIKICDASELNFDVDYKSTGKDLFELVCRTLGLREVWYFGLQYFDSKGDQVWLKPTKKIYELCSKKESPHRFDLRVKFYPESVSDEIIQDITLHLFFSQMRQYILAMDIYCPPEITIVLAAHTLQAKFGNLDGFQFDASIFSAEDLIPQRILDQFQMSTEMWVEKIKECDQMNKASSEEDAKMRYLLLVESLEMYGINFFHIKNKKKTELWLGVTCAGLNIYEIDNRLLPKIAFPWNEVKDVSFSDKKFIIKMVDKRSPNFTFTVEKMKTNKIILDLCLGNYELFMNRRKPESLEIQQLKAKTKEEKTLKMLEKEMLKQEKMMREAVEKKNQEQDRIMRDLQGKYLQLQEELRLSQDALLKSELTAELLGEKVSLIEEEVRLLKLKEAETEFEKQQLHMTSIKTEEEKVILERRAVEAELMAVQIVEECERRTKEADQLKVELSEARKAEEAARKKYQDFVQLSVSKFQSFAPMNMTNSMSSSDDTTFSQLLPSLDVSSLSREIEKDRSEFLERGQHLQKQLKNLKSEIEVLKVEEKQSQIDSLHDQLVSMGESKYVTLGKIRVGTAKSRVQFFEGL